MNSHGNQRMYLRFLFSSENRVRFSCLKKLYVVPGVIFLNTLFLIDFVATETGFAKVIRSLSRFLHS